MEQMGRLAGKRALVTGGGSGIGLAIAERFVAEGAQVAIAGRDLARLQSARDAISPDIVAIQVDVAQIADIERMMEEVRNSFGGLDCLVVNAGFARSPRLRDIDEAFFDRMIGTNLKGAFFTVTNAMPLLADGASVILMGSVAQDRGRLGTPLYSATKSAVRSLARTLAAEPEMLAARIRVNCISPGPIATPLTELHRADRTTSDKIAASVPLGRWGEPADVASAAVFLASAESAYMTGSNMAVDGGLGQF